MRLGNRGIITSRATLIGVSLVASSAPALAAEYKMTVNQDRLIHADREPQNWLMMNGDYGSTRYSKLSQINRDNVKNLHMVWAMALRGMQDCRAERAGERSQSADRQWIHVYERRLGHGLQDRRPQR